MRISDLSKWQVALLYAEGDYKRAEIAYWTTTKYALVWYYNNMIRPKREYSEWEIKQIIRKKQRKQRSKHAKASE